jgi:RNA polymerase sigma-70 factor (ECF subfamily)
MDNTIKFEQFMRNYQDMVYSVAVRLLASDADAQDVAQTVFLKAYENFATLDGNPSAGGWLKTVTTNLCLNHLSRYRARWRFFSEMKSEEDDRSYEDSVPANDRMDATIAESDYRVLLEQAIRKLPNAQRVPLVLYHFEDQSYEEIAKTLRVSLSKVKTDIHRARLALKRYIRPEMFGDEFVTEVSTSSPSPKPQRPEPRNPALAGLFPKLSPSMFSHAT